MKTTKLITAAVIIYILFGAISLYQGKPKIDEAANHLPVLKGMYEQGYINYILSENYAAANTPLPYLPVLAVYKISKVFNMGSDLQIARMCNIIFSLLTLLLFIGIYKKLNNGKADYSILIFLFYPYFLKTSFTFYMALYGVMFLLITILLLQSNNNLKILYAGLSAAAGILSQQFLIAIPIAFISERFVKVKRQTADVKRERKDMIKSKIKSKIKSMRDVVFFIPLIIPAVLFIKWGGLTHPNWRMHSPVIDISHVTAIFVIIGGVLFPYVIQSIQWSKATLIILILSFVLTFFFMPEWAPKGDAAAVTGYTYHFLEKVKEISSFAAGIIQLVLCFAGIFTLFKLYKDKNGELENILFHSIIFFGIIFSLNTVFAERHLLPMITALLLLVLPRIKMLWFKFTWTVFQIIFGCIYFYYWLFLNPNYPAP